MLTEEQSRMRAKEVFKLLHECPKFKYERVEELILPVTFFSPTQVARLVLFETNLSSVINNPISSLHENVVIELSNLVSKRFQYVSDGSPYDLLTSVATWIKHFVGCSSSKELLDRMERRIAARYGENIAFEVTRWQRRYSVEEMEKIIISRAQRLKNIPSLTKQDLRELSYFRLVVGVLRSGRYNPREMPPFTKDKYREWKRDFGRRFKIGHLFNPKTDSLLWSYHSLKSSVIEVKQCAADIAQKFSGYDKIFLARDATILFEALLAIGGDADSGSMIMYMSRDTLNNKRFDDSCIAKLTRQDIFESLKSELLDPAIKKHGLGDIGLLVEEVKNRIRSYYEQHQGGVLYDTLSTLFQEIYYYIKGKISSNHAVFIDTSSTTFPVLLCAFCELMFPKTVFRPYFGITPYTDPRAGFKINSQKSFLWDTIPAELQFHPSRSTLIPYDPKLSANSIRQVAGAFTARVLLYLP